jgi:hypothetical protein
LTTTSPNKVLALLCQGLARRTKTSMDRIAFFLFLYFLAPCAFADVYYLCNPLQDYIAIIDTYFSIMEPVTARRQS